MSLSAYAAGAAGALLIGFSKTGIPGLGILIVPLVAIAFPVKETVGIVLPMLLIGDLFAVVRFRRNVEWKRIGLLLPFVYVGMIPGFYILTGFDSAFLKPLIGILILTLAAVELFRRIRGWKKFPDTWWFSAIFGALAGFATAIAHAAGPVMGIYLLSRGLDKDRFMGTRAWFFFIVNLSKLPVLIPKGLINADSLALNLKLLPFIITGVFIGFTILKRTPQKAFAFAVIGLAAAAALKMILA